MVIVDTTVWIDYLGGTTNAETEWLDSQLDQERIGLTDLILCEILQGIRHDKAFTQARKQLSAFLILDSAGEDLAVAAAQNYRYLRSRGCTVRKTIDCIIATVCLRGGHSLLHRDRDFDSFEEYLGLQVIRPRLV